MSVKNISGTTTLTGLMTGTIFKKKGILYTTISLIPVVTILTPLTLNLK